MKALLSWRDGDDGLPPRQRILAMMVLMSGSLMAVLNINSVNIALPTIARELDVSSAASVWIINVYQLVGAASMLTFAALGYRIGRYRLYIGGMIVFVLTSIACALAPSLGWLIGFRAVQGLGSAAMMSIGPSMYRVIFPTRLLGQAMGLTALTVSLAVAGGPALGGLILSVASWPWLFWINLPFGIAAICLAIRALPQEQGSHYRFDVLGAVLSAVGLGAFVVMLDSIAEASRPGSVPALLIVSLVALAGFIWRQRHFQNPLLPLIIFREARFTMAVMTSFFSFLAQSMAFISLPFLFQSVQGYTPLESAILFTPWPLGVMIGAPLGGRLADRFSPPVISSMGLLLFIAGLFALALLGDQPSTVDILWRSALCGMGFGLYQAPNNREMMGSLPKARSGSASGVLASVRTFGQSVGAALVALVLSGIMSHTTDGALTVSLALWMGMASAIAALVLSASRIRLLGRPRSG
ncbi:MFS transporter, DHA2 family, multidrug resistance protein [Kushneria avicenniae]|uniref:MFS transporter, DHA2 family, multidrug resistance protein n=1 Tax=Kushneria avicenniae TaxID=402385 RepID=A0A1I1HTD0_9GAMM|nr:DHA2 family efflux MFS transporter permease subunit [Kushneria avicenniae]SFC27327.1 MFS transporter, DHA2 family, multidrug resistance protein [Kushneria avicenniae]